MARCLSLIAIAALCACASAPQPMSPAARSIPATQPGPPPPTVALEREVRFYVDEQGNVWDDRGKRHERAP